MCIIYAQFNRETYEDIAMQAHRDISSEDHAYSEKKATQESKLETSKETLQLASRFLDNIAKQIKPKTQPRLIRQILKNLRLDEFKTSHDPYLDKFLAKIQKESIDMTHFITHMKKYLLDNSTFCKLFEYIERRKLISNVELPGLVKTLELQLNVLCIFEAIMVTLMNSNTLADDIYQLIKSHRSFSSGNTFLNFLFGTPLDSGFFPRIKLVSVEPVWTSFTFHQGMGAKNESPEDLKKFIKEQKLCGPNASIIQTNHDGEKDFSSPACIGLNVSEAVVDEQKNKKSALNGKANAYAGSGWIEGLERLNPVGHIVTNKTPITPKGIVVNKKGFYLLLPGLKIKKIKCISRKLDMGKDLTNLYSTWNARFVAGNYDPVFMILKLFLPSVIGAEVNEYMNTRVLALWLFGNLYMQEKTYNQALFKADRLEYADDILAYWSRLNEKEVDKFLNKPGASRKAYQSIFGEYPTFNLIKNIYSFFQNGNDNRFTDAGIEARDKRAAESEKQLKQYR